MRGTKGVGNIRGPQGVHERPPTAAQEGARATTRVTGQGLPNFGTQVLMNVINEIGRAADAQSPRRAVRGRQGHLGRGDARAAPDRRQAEPGDQRGLLRLHHRLRPHLQAGRERTSPSRTSPQYWGASGGLEYEAAWALGAANGVDDLEALTYANFLCNEDGIDPDLVRRHGRRGDGALRPGHPHEGAGRLRAAVRLGRGAGQASPR